MENFSPVCRGEYSPVLHVSLQPGMNFGVFIYLYWRETANCKQRQHPCMMAYDKRAREMLGLLILQFGMFVTLVLQCHGLFVTYKLLEMKRNQMLCMHLSAKKSYLMKKRKHAQLRRLRRKHKSVWVVVNGRTDQWWRNMIGGNLPGSFWKKNFRMSKDLFHELAAELVSYIAPNPSSPNYRLLDTEKSLEQLRQDRIDTDQLHISREVYDELRIAWACHC